MLGRSYPFDDLIAVCFGMLSEDGFAEIHRVKLKFIVTWAHKRNNMKNRFTTVIVATTVAMSLSLLAFTSARSVKTEKKNVCTEKSLCPKAHCPATPSCPHDNGKDDCCDDK